MIQNYPKPGPIGGKLIRLVLRFFREEHKLSKGSVFPRLLIASSGGCDSTALAVLIARYGRKIVAPEDLTLVHINHGWRGAESDGDSKFVRELAQELRVGCLRFRSRRLPKEGDSWEDAGRKLRKRLFRKALHRQKAPYILTAHTKNDLFETKVWRFFTGAWENQSAGILPEYRRQLRPLLDVPKQELQAFLKEEGLSWREDSSNEDTRFLRNGLRKELIPVVDRLFPGAVNSVCRIKPNPAVQKRRPKR